MARSDKEYAVNRPHTADSISVRMSQFRYASHVTWGGDAQGDTLLISMKNVSTVEGAWYLEMARYVSQVWVLETATPTAGATKGDAMRNELGDWYRRANN